MNYIELTLFTGSSETPDECGMSSVVTQKTDEALYLNSFCFGFRFNELGNVNPDYAMHLFRSDFMRKAIAKTANGVTRFNVSKKRFAELEIPLPPLTIQSAIVSILDKFTTLEVELEARLETEQNYRKQQYEYYRNKLLSFGNDNNVEWKNLEDIFELRNGYTPSKNNDEFWTNGTIPWFRMEDIRTNGRILSDSIQHITPAAIKGAGLFEANSFILATTATIGEHALVIVDSLANQRFTNLKIRKSLIDEVDIKFMYHYMFIIDKWCKEHINISGFASVDMKGLKKLPIPIPPLEEQSRIANILDRFETLTTSISEGLPAEIAARKQQYEYYRNKLLTFNRKAV